MGYLVEAFNKMKHMLQNTVPGDVLDNPKKSDSRPASRATIYGKRHDIRRLTVVVVVVVVVVVAVVVVVVVVVVSLLLLLLLLLLLARRHEIEIL